MKELVQKLVDALKECAPRTPCKKCRGTRKIEIRGPDRDCESTYIDCGLCAAGWQGDIQEKYAQLVSEAEAALQPTVSVQADPPLCQICGNLTKPVAKGFLCPRCGNEMSCS